MEVSLSHRRERILKFRRVCFYIYIHRNTHLCSNIWQNMYVYVFYREALVMTKPQHITLAQSKKKQATASLTTITLYRFAITGSSQPQNPQWDFCLLFSIVSQVINLPLMKTIPMILHEWFCCGEQNWWFNGSICWPTSESNCSF